MYMNYMYDSRWGFAGNAENTMFRNFSKEEIWLKFQIINDH